MRSETADTLFWYAISVVAISVTQVIIFFSLYEAVVEIYVSNIGEMSKIFGFGMQVNVAVYLMNILAGINSLAQIFAKKLIVKMIVPLLCTTIWIAFWGNIADVVPNRFVFLSLIGMIAFYAGVVFGYREDQSPWKSLNNEPNY